MFNACGNVCGGSVEVNRRANNTRQVRSCGVSEGEGGS